MALTVITQVSQRSRGCPAIRNYLDITDAIIDIATNRSTTGTVPRAERRDRRPNTDLVPVVIVFLSLGTIGLIEILRPNAGSGVITGVKYCVNTLLGDGVGWYCARCCASSDIAIPTCEH